ncbi:MAG: hypothetical protein ACI9KE_003812 [Polyangiales bacterium]|jgi:hypothetical protein
MNASDALKRLREDEDFLREGVSIVVDAGLRRPLHEYIDVSVLTDVVSKGLGEAFVTRLFEEHTLPSRDRIFGNLDGHSVSTLLPESALPALEELAATMALPRFGWLEGAVEPRLIRTFFGPVWQEIFFRAAPSASTEEEGEAPSMSDSLVGLGKGLAGAFAKVGSSAMKGVQKAAGGSMDKAFSDFSEGATVKVRRAIVRRAQSEEGGAILETIRRQLFAHIHQAELAAITADWERMPLDALMRMAPPIVAHNAASTLGRRIVRSEVESILATEGERSVHEVFDEAKTLPEVRAYLRVTGEGLLRDLLGDEAFRGWIARWLEQSKSE